MNCQSNELSFYLPIERRLSNWIFFFLDLIPLPNDCSKTSEKI